jgi:CheY-like chemotaxis protein
MDPDMNGRQMQLTSETMDPKNNRSDEHHQVEKTRILLVDDSDDVRAVYQTGLERRGFEVVTAKCVNEALGLISTERFDVLLSDLNMPGAGDGFTVVSAMRHLQPHAVTLILSGYPALQDAANAILKQADQILVKPFGLLQLAELIQKKLSSPTDHMTTKKERVAAILERDLDAIIQNWLSRVELNEELMSLPLNYAERTGHLPKLLADLVLRLGLTPSAKIPVSDAARQHGVLRRIQGYTVAMVVEESRNLQVSIFNTLQNNLMTVDFSTVLIDVMTIADEVDAQLKQAMLGYMAPLPAKSMGSSA